MHIVPIFSALRRHRTAATLIVLEIALTCAIVSNAVFLIGDRLARMGRDTGLAEDEIVRITLTGIGKNEDAAALTREDLAALGSLPGVRAVAMTNQIPFGKSSWNSGIMRERDQSRANLNASTYFGSEDLVETLGVEIVAGRDFTPEEYVDWEASRAGGGTASPATTIVTRGLAEDLFPGESAVGKTIYLGDDPLRVVGVLERLRRPNEQSVADHSMIIPLRLPYTVGGNYLLRVDPERRRETLEAAAAALERNSRRRILLEQQTFGEIRAAYFEADRAMAWLLVAICLALLLVTALGIVGLASFWVQQRHRQIGIRRALGATRGQILRYFQVENLVLASAGITLGMVLAYAINFWLMQRYELPRLPGTYLPLGALALLVLGQVAVLGPALRASTVSPAVATRTV